METKVSFLLPAETVAGAASGVLVGEFNNWNPEEGIYLQKREDGSMVAELVLTEGKTYEYRYLLSDGRWVNDNSSTKFTEVYGYAIENRVIDVPETIKLKKEKTHSSVKSSKVKSTAVKAIVKDDLTMIEGINKKTEALLTKENISTYKALGKTTIKKLQFMLDAAGSKFSNCNPASWPKQAKLAAEAKWDELTLLKAELKKKK